MSDLSSTIKDLQAFSIELEAGGASTIDIETIDEAVEYLKELKDLSEMVEDFRKQTKAYSYR